MDSPTEETEHTIQYEPIAVPSPSTTRSSTPATAHHNHNHNQDQTQTQNQTTSARPAPLASSQYGRQSSIRIRRLVPTTSVPQLRAQDVRPPSSGADGTDDAAVANRRRSSSEPQRPNWVTSAHHPLARPTTASEMSPVLEEAPQIPPMNLQRPSLAPPTEGGYLRRASMAARSALGMGHQGQRRNGSIDNQSTTEYGSDMVDLLDTLDPEVSTLTSLTNVQNSLFIPDLGSLLNRRPTYILTRPMTATTAPEALVPPETIQEEQTPFSETLEPPRPTRTTTQDTITSHLTDSHFAVLPHGVSVHDWSPGEKEELNDLVRHMLHSRRARMKRSLKGFGHYVRRPLGFFVTLYATLITLFGLAWVLFLIGWINVGGKQLYIINVIDYVLVALFAIMGDGLAPFRTVDTYHMIFIAHYHHLTWKLRRKKALPKLGDKNDLPTQRETDVDVEDSATDEPKTEEYIVLNQKQQKKLQHHQTKFSKSHTFYKPHETETHYAFPLSLLIAIVVLLDFHSLLQISLGACTWGIDYHHRPFALTTVILCCSITCNITAGILIMIGDRRTRKKDVLERMDRQELTQAAIDKVEERRVKERERNRELEEKDEST